MMSNHWLALNALQGRRVWPAWNAEASTVPPSIHVVRNTPEALDSSMRPACSFVHA